MARPPKPIDQQRSQILKIRLSSNERKALEKGAEVSGVPLSEFVRNAALDRCHSFGPAWVPPAEFMTWPWEEWAEVLADMSDYVH